MYITPEEKKEVLKSRITGTDHHGYTVVNPDKLAEVLYQLMTKNVDPGGAGG